MRDVRQNHVHFFDVRRDEGRGGDAPPSWPPGLQTDGCRVALSRTLPAVAPSGDIPEHWPTRGSCDAKPWQDSREALHLNRNGRLKALAIQTQHLVLHRFAAGMLELRPNVHVSKLARDGKRGEVPDPGVRARSFGAEVLKCKVQDRGAHLCADTPFAGTDVRARSLSETSRLRSLLSL